MKPRVTREAMGPGPQAIPRLTLQQRKELHLLYPEKPGWRPSVRADCRNVPRPCPYVGCKYNLFLDPGHTPRSIKINFPDKEVWECEGNCALDSADEGEITLDEIALKINVSRERVRQIETNALRKLKALQLALALLDCIATQDLEEM